MGKENKNIHKVYTTLGASNHSKTERVEHDYYATSPIATRMLLDLETFSPNIWECASGGDHIVKVLKEAGYNVWATDIIDRTGHTEILDFLTSDVKFDGDIITNPPYSLAQKFVEKALDSITDGHKVAMYLRLLFLEGKKRQQLFKQRNLKTVYVAAGRMGCGADGKFFDQEREYEGGSVAFAWFVWEKGYNGDPVIKWFNNEFE
jgi:hypothetical protein